MLKQPLESLVLDVVAWKAEAVAAFSQFDGPQWLEWAPRWLMEAQIEREEARLEVERTRVEEEARQAAAAREALQLEQRRCEALARVEDIYNEGVSNLVQQLGTGEVSVAELEELSLALEEKRKGRIARIEAGDFDEDDLVAQDQVASQGGEEEKGLDENDNGRDAIEELVDEMEGRKSLDGAGMGKEKSEASSGDAQEVEGVVGDSEGAVLVPASPEPATQATNDTGPSAKGVKKSKSVKIDLEEYRGLPYPRVSAFFFLFNF